MSERSTEYRYMPEFQDGTAFRDDAEPGGTWWAAGDIYGYEALADARAALAGEAFNRAQWLDRPDVTATRIWRTTTTQELI